MFKMLKKKKGRKGQSTVEYIVLIIIVIGALLTIQVYVKRGIQGRMKTSSDDIGDQFSPGNTRIVKNVTSGGITTETASGLTGSQTNFIEGGDFTRTTSNMAIINIQQEYWGK